ncbi:hypothetical protein K435DRAFT_961723 [Dendrothele bispora CBS 962.96]|uniref:Uncharacterized protein n=1 Tax=Dendrothele bispora (strain CBS 962.96) TaxID=1314807 RepID=A0A4S8MP09_DENBC|nr:hypothetical protein K435DRAFT_961723 [Dendrothele bispora CBS 962.96]
MASLRGRTLAVGTVAAIAVSAGAMYSMTRENKKSTSDLTHPMNPEPHQKTIGGTGDEHLSPAAVSELVTKGRTKDTNTSPPSK